MSLTIDDTLGEAIATRNQLTLIPLNVDAPRTEKAKFLSLAEDGIWVQPAEASGTVARKLISGGIALEAQFFDRVARYSFATRLLRRKPDYWLTDTVAIEAWLLDLPASVQTVQQRIRARYRVAENRAALRGKLSLGGGAGSATAGEVAATIVDLSVGGIGLVCPSVPAILRAAPRVVSYQMVIQFGTRSIRLNGVMAHARPVSSQSMRLGIEFLPAAQQPPNALSDLKTLLQKLDPQTIWQAE